MKEDRERRRKWEAELGLRPSLEDEDIDLAKPEFMAVVRQVWNARAFVPAFRLPMGLAIPGWLMTILIAVLAIVVGHVTPILREKLVQFLLAFYAEAKESVNPWDDYLALFLLIIAGVPIPE